MILPRVTSVMTRKRLRAARESGQALVEFAVVVVVFLTFIFGIIDCARLFESWTAVQHASREGARMAVTGQTSCKINGTTFNTRDVCIVNTVKNSTTGMLGGGINASALTIVCQSSDYPNYTVFTTPSTNCSTIGTDNKPCDSIEVKVTYTHKFMTFFLSAIAPNGMSLIGRQRMISEPFGPCA